MKPIDIIYEDNHLLVVHKPPNIPVQEDASGDKDFLNILKEYIKEKYDKPGDVFLGLVHRLDRPAQGIMVFARTSKAASRLSEQFREKTVRKTYLIITEGKELKEEGTLHDFLFKDRQQNKVFTTSKSQSGAKEAQLSYKTITRVEELNLAKVELDTGRSHQIRVQLRHAGSPLWGDQKYNKSAKVGQQLALLSHKLEFDHPTTKERLTFSTKIPQEYPWNLFGLD